MSASERLRALGYRPDDPIPLRVYECIERETQGGPRLVSTVWLATNEGMSAEWWRDQARAGRVPGAFQAEEGGPWTLPLEEARAYLARLSMRGDRRRSTRRGPNRKAS